LTAAAVTASPTFNSRLAIQVGDDGRFNVGAFPDPTTGESAPGSWDLMYSWPSPPGTSFTTFRINDIDYIYGDLSGTFLEPPHAVDANTNQSKWQVGDIVVTQKLQIVFNPQTGQQDLVRISYTVQNTGTSMESV